MLGTVQDGQRLRRIVRDVAQGNPHGDLVPIAGSVDRAADIRNEHGMPGISVGFPPDSGSAIEDAKVQRLAEIGGDVGLGMAARKAIDLVPALVQSLTDVRRHLRAAGAGQTPENTLPHASERRCQLNEYILHRHLRDIR